MRNVDTFSGSVRLLFVPRKPPISKQDLEIAQRLIWLRSFVELPLNSREALAKRSKISSGYIKMIELGRVPIRYDSALALMQAYMPFARSNPFPINPLWLGQGKEPIQVSWPLLLPKPDALGIDPATRFSVFVNQYERLLARLVEPSPTVALPESWLDPYMKHWGTLRVGADEREKGIDRVKFVFLESASKLARVSAVAVAILSKFENVEADLEAWRVVVRKEFVGYSKAELDSSPATDRVARVSAVAPTKEPRIPTWKQLVSDVKSMTKEQGAKAALAGHLKTSRQNVNHWLSMKGAPSAELTLSLLRWVRGKQGQ